MIPAARGDGWELEQKRLKLTRTISFCPNYRVSWPLGGDHKDLGNFRMPIFTFLCMCRQTHVHLRAVSRTQPEKRHKDGKKRSEQHSSVGERGMRVERH